MIVFTSIEFPIMNQDYSLENQERGRGLRKMERNMRNWFGGFLCTVFIRLTALGDYKIFGP